MKLGITKFVIVAAIAVLAVVSGSTAAWAEEAAPCPTSPSYSPDFSSEPAPPATPTCLKVNGAAALAPPASFTTPPVGTPNPAQAAPSGVNQVLRLTPNSEFLAGSAWFNNQQPVAAAFSTTFTFQLSDTIGAPGDGIAFVIQNSSLTALDPDTGGTDGCSLGYGDDPANTGCTSTTGGIPSSLAIEFDTFQNTDDPNANHVAIQSCGTAANSSDNLVNGVLGAPGPCNLAINPLTGVTNPITGLPINMADGSVHTVTITYTPSTLTTCGPVPSGPQAPGGTQPGTSGDCSSIDVILDGADLFPGGVLVDLSTLLNLPNTNNLAWVGFTGATGGADEDNDILSWTFAPTQQGTPISTTPTPAQLNQTFVINPTSGLQWNFNFNYLDAAGDGITVQSGTTPFVSSLVVTPTDWTNIANGTQMADTTCLLASATGQSCAVNTLACTTTASSTPAGANCPVSTARNILFTQQIDLVQNQTNVSAGTLTIPSGSAPGLAMLPDVVPPGPQCTYPTGPLSAQLCPQNIMTQLVDGSPKGGGTASLPNSTYVLFCCEPERTTAATIPLWSNLATGGVPVRFNSAPPLTPVPNPNNFQAAQGASVVVGAELRSLDPLDTTYPLPGEVSLPNSTPCPALGTSPNTPWSTQASAAFTVNGSINSYINSFTPGTATTAPSATTAALTEGAYNAHFYSVDCDNFEELVYPASINVAPGPATTNVVTFKTVPFNVDTTPPAVTSITLSQPSGYVDQGAPLTATVVCTDPTSHTVFSGIGQCGSQGSPQAFVGNQQTVSTTPISLSTSTLGINTFTAIAQDVAGNSSTASVTYQVVGTDDLAVLMLGNLTVKTGGTITYDIIVANGGPNASSLTKVTDSLPAGTTFVSAGYAIDSVTVSGGQITRWSITPPTMSCGNSPANTWQGSCSIGTLPAWTGKNPVAAIVQITVKVTAGAGTIIKNNAAVSSVNADSDVKYTTSPWATLVTK
jgi:uncharacterized repeat protein (TIGR01451 family)